ncbi:MAG: FecR domain-containing protein [Cytophagales bacterium]|nr:FecR domain-containing protein [Cytophagales bacterium]
MDLHQEEINKLILEPGFRNWAARSDAEDFEKWENLLRDDRELSRLAQEAKKVVLRVELSESKQEKEDFASYERLMLKRKNGNSGGRSAGGKDTHSASRVLGIHHLVKIAAVLSFIVVFSGLLYFTADRNSDPPAPVVAEIVKKQTQNGQHLAITLPDGSKVKLNSNSTISYPREFFKNRRIELEGEAFFSVVRDETSPFVVQTEHFQTEVLGTSFNINAYRHADAKVSVAEGKVKVSSVHGEKNPQYKILVKEEAVEIREKEIKASEFNLDEMLWKDGILVFSNESIQTISSKIQRWFNVSVTVKNVAGIAGEFSGKYSNESLEEILTGMGYALNFSFEMKGSEIIISGKN